MNFPDPIYFCLEGSSLNRNDKLYFHCYKTFLKLIRPMDNGSHAERGRATLHTVRGI